MKRRVKFIEDSNENSMTSKVNYFLDDLDAKGYNLIDIVFKTAALQHSGYFCVMITYEIV